MIRAGSEAVMLPGSGPVGLRRALFTVWAALLSLVLGVVFVGTSALTISLRFAGRNRDTTPVTDLALFALGGVIITVGLLAQLRCPERHIAGLQQAVVGLVALGLAGLLGRRVEPLVGSLVVLLMTGVLVALHPARRVLLTGAVRPAARLVVAALVAAVPAGFVAAALLGEARRAGPSCFFGRCAYGDRLAEMAALAIALVANAVLAAVRTPGWRLTAWCVGVAAVISGITSMIWPDVSGSLGLTTGAGAVAWGVLFVVLARTEPDAGEGTVHERG